MKAKDLVLGFASLWREKYGKNYPVSFAKDCSQAKRLLNLYGDEAATYVRHYLSGFDSAFARRAGHSFGAFVVEIAAVVASHTTLAQQQELAAQANSDFEKRKAAREGAS
jgi:hypothetical protein